MRWKIRPEDFRVEERVALSIEPSGPYTLYRVRKWGRTTLEVQAELAARLGVSQRAVIFPALKDRWAIAVQIAAIRGQGPERIRGPGFEAVRIGYASRPPRPQDLRGNRFWVRLRALTREELEGLPQVAAELAAEGFPNYFDDQRFGSWSPEMGFVGRALLRGQAEDVLRMVLAVPMAGDPPAIRAFKAEARARWGDWAALFAHAPRPSMQRSLLTFLKDHPTDLRGAVRRIPLRLRLLWVDAYRAWLWNRAVGYGLGPEARHRVLIRGEEFPLPDRAPPEAQGLFALPHRRARDAPPWAEAMARVLEEEGLSLADFRRGPLLEEAPPPTRRPIWCRPVFLELRREAPEAGEAILCFELPPGSYGTLLLKALAARRSPCQR